MGGPSSGEAQDAGSNKSLVEAGEHVSQCVAEVLLSDVGPNGQYVKYAMTKNSFVNLTRRSEPPPKTAIDCSR